MARRKNLTNEQEDWLLECWHRRRDLSEKRLAQTLGVHVRTIYKATKRARMRKDAQCATQGR